MVWENETIIYQLSDGFKKLAVVHTYKKTILGYLTDGFIEL